MMHNNEERSCKPRPGWVKLWWHRLAAHFAVSSLPFFATMDAIPSTVGLSERAGITGIAFIHHSHQRASISCTLPLAPPIDCVAPEAGGQGADSRLCSAGLLAAGLGGLAYIEQGGVTPADSAFGVPVAGSETRP